MSTKLKKKRLTAPVVEKTVKRKPQQGRSKASLERMVAAARELMLERGNEEFTLYEVSQVGSVSIGSIYLRFESKDNLVRAVIAEVLEEISRDETLMLKTVSDASNSLSEFVPNYVEAYAEVLRRNAPLLRLSMDRASHDPLVSGPGKQSALRSAAEGTAAMLAHAAEFGGKDHATKAGAAYQVIFSTLARELSLGSTSESVHAADWTSLKRELGRMCLAYLKAAD